MDSSFYNRGFVEMMINNEPRSLVDSSFNHNSSIEICPLRPFTTCANTSNLPPIILDENNNHMKIKTFTNLTVCHDRNFEESEFESSDEENKIIPKRRGNVIYQFIEDASKRCKSKFKRKRGLIKKACCLLIII